MFNFFRKQNVLALLAVAMFCLFALTNAQVPSGVSGKKVSYSHYEGSQARALITADDVKPLQPMSAANILAQGFKLVTFRDGVPTNVEAVIESPECVFNYNTHLAFSTNRIQLYNGQTNLFIEGRGFCWQPGPTNILTISNDVHTVIQRVTNAPVGSDSALHLYSDRFRFLAVLATNVNTRIAFYDGHVRADDPQMRLTAEEVVADFSGTNEVNHIVAETNVVIVGKTDGSQATGDRAVYRKIDGKRFVELTGNPHWHDSKNEGTAKRFFVRPDDRVVWLEGDAKMRLPQSSVSQPDLLGLSSTNSNTNQPITVAADVLKINATTNKQGRTLYGQTNFVITANDTRATADSAFFSEASGLLRLTNATWGGEKFVAKGALLTFDRSNKVFHAEQDAFLKLPAKSLNGVTGTRGAKTSSSDNRWIEISCDNYDIQTNNAVFNRNVRVNFSPQTNSTGLLKCDRLRALFRDKKVQTLVAEGHVDLNEKLSSATNTIVRQVNCELLTIHFRNNGNAESVQADRSVIAEERAEDLIKKQTRHRRLSAATVQLHFSATTNQMDRVTADRNVYIEQDGSWAQGDQIVYLNSDNEESATLIGNPKVLLVRKGHQEPIPMTAEHALQWNLKTDVVKSVGLAEAHVVAPKSSGKKHK